MKRYLVLSLLLLGCGNHGPKLTYCISDPAKNQFACHDQKKNKNIKKTPDEVVGWTCAKGVEVTGLLDACNRKQIPPKRNQCLIEEKEKDYNFRCFDQKKDLGFDLPYKDSENYVCLSVDEFLFLLDYCERKRTKS